MAEFYKFIISYEVLIYIVLAIGGMFSFRSLLKSWREWQIAVYSLERQFSSRRFGQSASISTLVVILFCFVFSMRTFIIPSLPASAIITTPTIDFISTPTGTLSVEMMTQFANFPLQTTVANTTGCVPDQINFNSPKPGEEIKGTIEITGTVNIPNFGFYKYEVARQGDDTWATILAGRTIVDNGTLGRWDTTALTPGDYQLRLVVTDNQGVALSPCVVPVSIIPLQ